MSNVRAGDLAVVVRGVGIGGLVSVLEPLQPDYAGPCWLCETMSDTRGWRVSTGLETPVRRGSRIKSPDSYLRPLRDTDGADETLAWVPRGVPA